MTEYIVKLKRDGNEEEDFELGDNNVIRVSVQDMKGASIRVQYVNISLTRDAMLGLGKALIRKAHVKDIGVSEATAELTPVSSGFASLNMGVFLTPDSPQLNLLLQDELPTVDELIQSTKK